GPLGKRQEAGADELTAAEQAAQGEQPDHRGGQRHHRRPDDVTPVVRIVEAVAGPGDAPGGTADLASPVVIGEDAGPGVVGPAPPRRAAPSPRCAAPRRRARPPFAARSPAGAAGGTAGRAAASAA